MIARSDAEAEDATQEALLRGWRLRHTCQQPERYLAWLARIARREALRLRADARVPAALDDSLHASEKNELEQVLGQVELERVLRELAPEERSLVLLRYAEDLTYRELAKRLGMPVGTAKVRLHRLRARLRASLADPECPAKQAPPD